MVGKSILYEGIPIPYCFQADILNYLDSELEVGKSRFINIWINKHKFNCQKRIKYFKVNIQVYLPRIHHSKRANSEM